MGVLLRRVTSAVVLRVLLFAAIFSLAAVPPLDPDLWWHLADGRLMVATGSIPHVDVYSFSAAGHPWVMHEWLADLAMYLLYQAGGLSWLVGVFAGVVTAAAICLYLLLRRTGLPASAATVLTLVGALAGAIAAGGLLSVINPFGIQTILFSLGTLTSPLIQNNIQEWASPDFHALPGLLVEAIVFLLLAGLATGRVKARTSEWLLAFALLYLALSSQRHVPLFVLGAAPLMGRCAQALLSLASSLLPPADRRVAAQAALRWKPARPTGPTLTLGAINLALLIGVGAGMIWYRAVPNLRPAAEAAAIKAALPVQAADALQRTGRPLRVFNYYDYGGHLVWGLYPDGGRVFIDGRVEVYGSQGFSRYLRVSYLASGWQDVLAQSHPDAIVLPSAHPLTGLLEQDPAWSLLSRDGGATVFVRVGFAP